MNAAVQERQLAQALRQCVEAVDGGLENLGVRLERDFRAAALGRAGDFEGARRVPLLVALLIHLAVAPDFEIERFRQAR